MLLSLALICLGLSIFKNLNNVSYESSSVFSSSYSYIQVILPTGKIQSILNKMKILKEKF